MKFSMYWHNGRSLGHTAETAKIAKYFTTQYSDLSLSGLSGAFKGLDLLPSSMDMVKLPAFTNYDSPKGWGTSGRQGLPSEALFACRAEMAEVFIRHYTPDYFFVNHLPFGAENELIPALNTMRSGVKVLTLRGVLFDREKTNRLYFTGEPARWIEQNYDYICVHIDPAIFSLEDYYDIPSQLLDRIHYTGYLIDDYTVTPGQAREQLGLHPDEKIIVASMGGGQGAYRIWENMVKSLLKNKEHFDQAYIVTGPYLEKDDAIRLKKWAAELPWLHVLEYVPNMMAWMAASNLFIGAAGSNMLGEILATKCNAIVIPRQVREVEQKIHSALLKERGFVRVCDLEGVYDGKLDQQIYDGLQEPIAFRQSIQMNGTSAYSDILNLNKILV